MSHLSSVLDLATSCGIIEKSGAWFSYQGKKIGQGRENAKLFLRDNPTDLKKVENLIYEKKELQHLIQQDNNLKKKPSEVEVQKTENTEKSKESSS